MEDFLSISMKCTLIPEGVDKIILRNNSHVVAEDVVAEDVVADVVAEEDSDFDFAVDNNV